MNLTEIANPAAVAWHWQLPEFGSSEHAITWIRGTDRLSFGTKREDGTWIDTTIIDPERFGFDGTLQSARIAAQNFIDGREIGE